MEDENRKASTNLIAPQTPAQPVSNTPTQPSQTTQSQQVRKLKTTVTNMTNVQQQLISKNESLERDVTQMRNQIETLKTKNQALQDTVKPLEDEVFKRGAVRSAIQLLGSGTANPLKKWEKIFKVNNGGGDDNAKKAKKAKKAQKQAQNALNALIVAALGNEEYLPNVYTIDQNYDWVEYGGKKRKAPGIISTTKGSFGDKLKGRKILVFDQKNQNVKLGLGDWTVV